MAVPMMDIRVVTMRVFESLAEIAPNEIHELLGRFRLLRLRIDVRIDDVKTDVIFQDLRHEAVDRAATRRQLLQYRAAFALLLQEFLNAVHLAAQPADPVEQLRLITNGMRHRAPGRNVDILYRSIVILLSRAG
jgi:hypothetical protein